MLRWSRDKEREKTGPSAGGESGNSGLFRTHARPVRPLDEPRAVRDTVTPGDTHVTLESILVSEGTVTPQELKAAQEIQATEGGFLGQILIDLGYIDANSLTSFLAKHCKIPHLSLLDYLIDEAQVNLVPREICLKYRLLPIDRLGRNLTVAMVNPLDTAALDEVRRVCPDLRVKPILCEYSHFLAVAKRVFKIEEEAREVSMDTLGLGAGPSHEPKASAPAAPPDAAGDLEPLGDAQPVHAAENPLPAPKAANVEPAAPPASPRAAAQAPPSQPAAPKQPPSSTPPVPKHPEPAPVEVQTAEHDHVEASGAERAFDDEAVLEAFFGVSEEDEERAVEDGAEPSSGSSSVLQEMVAIMGDSMRDTYGMLARKLALFNGLSSEQVAKIFAKGITREFDEGQVVFNEGEAGEDLFVILGGSVAISHHGSEVARLIAGDAFGETALFTHEPRNATATAVETSSFLVLNEKAIRRILDKDTALQLLGNLVVSLSRRIRHMNEGS